MPVPTGRLALLAALLSVVLVFLPAGVGLAPGLAAVNLTLVIVALLDALLAPAPATVGVEREMPGVLSLGAAGEIVWRIKNPAGRAITVTMADELAPSLRATTRQVRVRVPARGRVTARTAIRPTRRGRFDPTDVAVRVPGPLGLAARQHRRQLPGTLRVYPPFRSRDEAELRINRARILEVGLRSAKGRGGGTEFDQLREYTVDDEFRRIDWAATARTGKAIVRTYRAERNQSVLLLLDSGRVMAGQVAGVPRIEHAMDAVMMLTAVATRLGDRAGLVTFADTVRSVVPPSHGRNQLGVVTEAMYAIDPLLVESDYRGAFVQSMARFRRRSMMVVFTELSEQAMEESLLPALPLVVRDHIVVVAAVADPDVARWAADTPTELGPAYRKSAASAAAASRRRLVARLRGMGVTVIDEPPGRLAPALADAYLTVKATGRL